MSSKRQLETLAQGQRLRLVKYGRWEFVQRTGASGVVIVIAVTEDEKLLFVEQYRAPVDSKVIEFPAGLIGDHVGQEDESSENAAARELWEETGYQAEKMTQVFVGASSAGLTDEMAIFLVAQGLKKVGPGEDVTSGKLKLHEIPLSDVNLWLQDAPSRDCLVGARVYSGLYLLSRFRQ